MKPWRKMKPVEISVDTALNNPNLSTSDRLCTCAHAWPGRHAAAKASQKTAGHGLVPVRSARARRCAGARTCSSAQYIWHQYVHMLHR